MAVGPGLQVMTAMMNADADTGVERHAVQGKHSYEA